MIKAGDFIKHRRFMDVMILVTSTPRIKDGVTHIEGFWYNMMYGEPSMNIGYVANIDIKPGDLKDWRVCVEPEIPNKRHARWEDIFKRDCGTPTGVQAS